MTAVHLRQAQFLDVIDRDEAERRFHAVLDLSPLPAEGKPLVSALHRVLASDVVAPALRAFCELLDRQDVRQTLSGMGFR